MSKTIVITGTSKGLGLKLAEHYSKSGATVVGLSRDIGPLTHPNFRWVQADVTDYLKLDEVSHEIFRIYGAVDLLVNNAAILTSIPFALMNPSDAKEMVEVNLVGTIFSCRAFLRGMINSGNGSIVNIISMSHRVRAAGDSVYAATKAAVEVFSNILNKETYRNKVRVNCLGVSAIETGMLAKVASSGSGKIIKHIPHAKLTTLQEIVHCIDFLSDPSSTDVGGQSIYLGGI